MKRDPDAPMFKGTKACGCVTWLYASEFDTPRQREKAVAEAIESGLTVTRLKSNRDMKAATAAWGACSHQKRVLDPRAEARKLLGVS